VTRVLVWIHPIVGLVATALAVHGMSLVVRARRIGARGARLRARHRALMPWVWGLVLVNFAGGAVSCWLWRDEDEMGGSGHFAVGILLVVLFTLAGLAGRRIDRDSRFRSVHPWIGAAALLAAGVQVFLGLQIVPH
jgi:uncharacterized protein DUF4079